MTMPRPHTLAPVAIAPVDASQRTEADADARFVAAILAICSRTGIQVDDLTTRFGHCFAFVLSDGRRVTGSMQQSRPAALLNACKELLPHIYRHLV